CCAVAPDSHWWWSPLLSSLSPLISLSDRPLPARVVARASSRLRRLPGLFLLLVLLLGGALRGRLRLGLLFWCLLFGLRLFWFALCCLGRLLLARLLLARLLLGRPLLGRLLLLRGGLLRLLRRPRDLTVVDLTSPALQLVVVQHGLGHHMALEVLQLQPDPPALGSPEVRGLLEEALRVVLQHHQDPGQVGRQLVERDRAVHVPLRPFRPPDDPLVRHLVDDRGFPVPVGPEDLPAPLEFGVGVLLDLLHLLHEAGEVGEPGPLVVRHPDRHAHVDVLDDVRDLAEVTTTTATTVTAVAGDGLLGLPGHPLDHPATDGLGEPGRAVPAGNLLADLADRRGGL